MPKKYLDIVLTPVCITASAFSFTLFTVQGKWQKATENSSKIRRFGALLLVTGQSSIFCGDTVTGNSTPLVEIKLSRKLATNAQQRCAPLCEGGCCAAHHRRRSSSSSRAHIP
jgi:hypothetical protein